MMQRFELRIFEWRNRRQNRGQTGSASGDYNVRGRALLGLEPGVLDDFPEAPDFVVPELPELRGRRARDDAYAVVRETLDHLGVLHRFVRGLEQRINDVRGRSPWNVDALP